MPKNPLPSLSASEQAIMDFVWKRQPVGLNDLLELVNADRPEPVTRATLQTQLTRLEAKGWLKRDDSARAHLYSATMQENRGRKTVLSELKERFFGGSSLALVRCLVESGEISADEMAELRDLVRQKSGGES
ncbi:MAG: BlaI/MecI/CopY family transcriptional regulator [Verrucomicrobiales bacterium]|nr:BlaI/MecI/CopY family transcriptional regulator [Verrucomicrobiales bacterium]MCP5560613.1 BlaI/MecI/CopY family transcriptional regulator [Verrucomicrobiaceae bacterium]